MHAAKQKMVARSMGSDFPNQTRLVNFISSEVALLAKDNNRSELVRQGLGQTLTRHLGLPAEPLAEYPMEAEQAARFEVLRPFIALFSLQHSLTQVEYYFRRYPFRGLPVGHSDHLRNICEMYFDRIEQFRQRLKALTVALKKFTGKADERYGQLIKIFSSYFSWENKQRNLVHHNRRFEYDAIDQLNLIELLKTSPEMSELPSANLIYRQEARKWVSRVRAHGLQLAETVEIAAGFVLEVIPNKEPLK